MMALEEKTTKVTTVYTEVAWCVYQCNTKPLQRQIFKSGSKWQVTNRQTNFTFLSILSFNPPSFIQAGLLASGKKQVRSWTGRQPITGPTHREKEPHITGWQVWTHNLISVRQYLNHCPTMKPLLCHINKCHCFQKMDPRAWHGKQISKSIFFK